MNELNQRSTAPWLFVIGTHSRSLGIDGRRFAVTAWDLRQAIRETRKVVSPAWGLHLLGKERLA